MASPIKLQQLVGIRALVDEEVAEASKVEVSLGHTFSMNSVLTWYPLYHPHIRNLPDSRWVFVRW